MSRGNTYSVPRDANRVPALLGVSSVDGTTVLPAEINPISGALIVEGTVVVSPTVSTSATTTTFAADDLGVLILAATPTRTGGTIYNSGPNTVFICFSNTASTTDFIVDMAVGSYYELPFGYVGDVSAICNAAETANLTVSELS